MGGEDEPGSLLDELRQLPNEGRRCRFGPGESVFCEGAPAREFHFVTSGRVKLVKTAASGAATMLDIVEPSALVCGNAVFRGAPYCCSAVFGPEGGATMLVPRERLLRLVDEKRGLWRRLMHEVTCRGMVLCERVDEVGRGTVEHRVTRLLARLWSSVGQERLGQRWLPVRLSRRDLAQLCCARAETVIRVMTRLERDEVIETTSDGFRILDLDALLERSRGSGGR